MKKLLFLALFTVGVFTFVFAGGILSASAATLIGNCTQTTCTTANTLIGDQACYCGNGFATAAEPYCNSASNKGFTTSALCAGATTSGTTGLEKGLEKLTLPVAKSFPTGGIETVEDAIPLINRVGNYVFAFFMVAALILIVMSALQFITGGGDPKAVGEARQKMLWAFVGIGFALLAAFFDNIVASFLGVTGIKQ